MFPAFQAHPLIRGGQAQTLAAFFWPAAPAVPPDEVLNVLLPDGDQLEILVNHPEGQARGTLYLMHGLGGSADSSYLLRLAKKLTPDGFRVVRHNHRGCESPTSPSKGIYHSGATQDVLTSLHEIVKRWPGEPLAVVGFSLSGTILLNLLARQGEEIARMPEIKGALSVCAPLDLHASSRALSSFANRHFDYYFADTLTKQLLGRQLITSEYARKQLARRTLRNIDEYITAPRAGYRDAAHYYDECSPQLHLGRIGIPTLILAAADDPIVPAQSVSLAAAGRHVTVRLETSGGHMGFLARKPTSYGDYRWLDDFVRQWASQTL